MTANTLNDNGKGILVTGAAGFIGYHVCSRLIKDGWEVTGVDNLNAYYDRQLKTTRLDRLKNSSAFEFNEIDLSDGQALGAVFRDVHPRKVINLAAQAGVRYSLDHPGEYIQSNLVGFANVLEACRSERVEHLLYASSSSVYGANKATPYHVQMNVDHPLSLYAATKKSNELMAHSYSHLYGIPTTGLRFFTAYGPWGRPDMACFLFTKAILAGEPIKVFNHGEMYRDFTYIDDVAESVARLIGCVPQGDSAWDGKQPDPSSSNAPFRVLNIGNGNPMKLSQFITVLERELGVSAIRESYPMQPGDMEMTSADIGKLAALIDYRPSTTVEAGLKRFVAWYREYYGV